MKPLNPVCTISIGLALAITSLSGLADPIPHSTVSTAQGEGIVTAWFSCATERYAHGVLGDRIEAGCLIAKDAKGKRYQLDLPNHQVFEDLVPRIADLDNDGVNEVVTIRSDIDRGAAIVVYTISDEKLSMFAQTPDIGLAYRWLAPAGIADFNGNGIAEIAYVQTPHIGGILKIWEMQDGKLVQLGSHKGVSNHAIGSTIISRSKLLDHNNDGLIDLALPNQSGSRILIFSMQPDLSLIDDLAMDNNFF